ncbi:MAG TPA: DHHA1 domain-containing protein, partial [Burkholderiaceae bacterium]|nr:DHHA1 domain-containing protein [Burkholderiaceae bacterium]
DWIVTVDNGIASVDGVARARALGIQVMVTDHHLPGEQLPEAAVIVNPNQPGCEFPSKSLAGVGVMFYVLLALRAELRERGRFTAETQPRFDALLDLVALGTVADVVPLDRNNRILVTEGLKRIRSGRMHAGVAALFQVAGRDARLAQASDLGFTVGPRINAAGRLADMTLGIECLSTDDFERALTLAQTLDQINRERRTIEANMQWDALAQLEDTPPTDRRTLTLFDESWHQGVVGLVASRVKEKYHRPTIAFAKADGGWLRGSGRSIEGVHLRDVLDRVTKAAPSLIEKFGGHAMAAGLTLAQAHLSTFEQAFEQATRASSDASLFMRSIATDGPLAAHEINLNLTDALAEQVWGQGFAPPLFANEFTVLEQRLVKDSHLKLKLLLGEARFDAMWFRHTETLPTRVMLAYRIAADTWQGRRRISLIIEQAS